MTLPSRQPEPTVSAESDSTRLSRRTFRLRTCVWEITLACNCYCVHCGSSAGACRRNELTTTEALALIAELAELGCESVTLSGGEPLLREDWPELAHAIRKAGMRLEMITNGLCVAEQARVIHDCGFYGVTFSVDGPADIHDSLRGVRGALQRLLEGAEALRQMGTRIGAVTQINRCNIDELAAIHELLVAHGFEGWQWQLTMPQGRAKQRSEQLCLLPTELPRLEQTLLDFRKRRGPFIYAADNIGYMSRNEPLLRSLPGEEMGFWTGCRAGINVIGVTSDGSIRGCLSQPPAANEGNIRERGLSSIWRDPMAFAYNRCFRTDNLQGVCAGCAFGKICRGGCRGLAWAASPEQPCSNPYCTYSVTR